MEHPIFSRSIGLCHSSWLFAGGMDNLVEARDIEKELNAQFGAAGLDEAYPFNEGRPWEYERESAYKHQNKKRLQWVIDHAMVNSEEGTTHE